MSSTAVAIACTEASSHVDPAAPLVDRFNAAMKATYRHWMATSEDDQFMAAIEAVYLTATAEERDRIEAELRALRDLGALLSGVPVDLDQLATTENPIGLRALWIEIAHAR